MTKRDWTSEPPIVVEAAVPALIRKVLDSLHHIKEHTAAMALSLERIEEMAAEARDRERKYGFKYKDEEQDFDDPRDMESPA